MNDEQFVKLLEDFAQLVSYKFGDMINQIPYKFRPVAMAVVSSCIASQISLMSEEDLKVYEAMRKSSEIITLPKEMDPRKNL